MGEDIVEGMELEEVMESMEIPVEEMTVFDAVVTPAEPIEEVEADEFMTLFSSIFGDMEIPKPKKEKAKGMCDGQTDLFALFA